MADLCIRCHRPFASGRDAAGGWGENRVMVGDHGPFHAECADNDAAVDRVIKFLETCEDGDIRAGVGAILGLGSDETIKRFREGLADAISPRER
jgi:hypothetical protein